ncbi:MAG: lytic transglycosylase domain-containing protein [Pseudomonadota bacterium]
MNGRRILALTLGLSFLLTPVPGIADDIMYSCTSPHGPPWYGNDKGRVPKGYKCTVMFKMSDRTAPEAKDDAAKKESTKPRPRWTPPKNTQTATPAPGPVVPAPATAPPTEIDEIIRTASEAYDLPEAFIHAVITVESSYKTRALSHKGAMGLMQLMPGTARDLGVDDPYDPYQNIMGGSKFLRILADRFDGDMIKVVSAYHAGGGVTSRKDGTPWVGTDGYVRKVLKNYYRLKTELAATTP